ncbi:unnamed protein product [Anisakis simplex]|uniref:Zinc finger CCHC domain-containing protein 9 n=1 Tax=Anisakis simplex TaxID=6269 RepID=A0A0M3JZ87_ANISI|nr:unnamed protein product [Anisakis simplex]
MDVHEDKKPSVSKKGYTPSGANAEISDKEVNKIANELIRSVSTVDELKKKVQQMCREGKLGGHQGGMIIRRWRVHERQKSHLQKKDVMLNEISKSLEATKGLNFEDVKKMVNDYVQEGKITHRDAGFVISNWKRSEFRRVKRQVIKQDVKRCLFCREKGHLLSQCPNKDEQTMGTGICFKCGSSEHTSSKCPRKNVKGYPYAVCFVCKQQGHLSRDCDKNPNGIYPDGGSCDICGSQKHLKKDCPELKATTKDTKKRGNYRTKCFFVLNVLAARGTAMSGGDEDIAVEGDKVDSGSSDEPKRQKLKKKKIIRF